LIIKCIILGAIVGIIKGLWIAYIHHPGPYIENPQFYTYLIDNKESTSKKDSFRKIKKVPKQPITKVEKPNMSILDDLLDEL